jgi:hypothetical protein
MKSRITLSVFFVFFTMLFLSEVAQAQRIKSEIPKISLLESNYENPAPSSNRSTNTFTMKSAGLENMVVASKKLNEGLKVLEIDPIANDSEPIIVPRKVVFPKAEDLKRVNKKVAEIVAGLRAESKTSFSIEEHDNVLLRYDLGSDKIVLTAKDNRNLILHQVSRSTLNGVLTIQGNDNDNNLVVDNTILDLGIDILYDGGGEHTTKGDILTVINSGTAWEEVVSTAFNESSGRIVVDNKSSITYTGLEPIIFIGAGGNLVINLPNIANPDVVISNDVSPGFTLVSGSTFENIIFDGFDEVNISGGTDMDNVSFQGVDPTLDSNITLNFDTDDLVTFETTDTDLGSHNLNGVFGYLAVTANITTTGNIDLSSEKGTMVTSGATISVTNGTISLAGGTAIQPGDV